MSVGVIDSIKNLPEFLKSYQGQEHKSESFEGLKRDLQSSEVCLIKPGIELWI